MTKKKLFKVPLKKERLDQARKAKGLTITGLAGNKEDAHDYICSERTIRRAIDSGEINPAILDQIGKKLNVNPGYLSGNFDWPLDEIDDPKIREVYREEFLTPERHSYSHHLLEHTDYRKTLEMVLSSHGISQEEYKQQPSAVRREMESRIDELIVRTLRPVFPSAMWAELIQAGFGYKDMTMADVYEMLNQTLIDRGLAEDPFEDEEFLKAWDDGEDPFAEKYGIKPSCPSSNTHQ